MAIGGSRYAATGETLIPQYPKDLNLSKGIQNRIVHHSAKFLTPTGVAMTGSTERCTRSVASCFGEKTYKMSWLPILVIVAQTLSLRQSGRLGRSDEKTSVGWGLTRYDPLGMLFRRTATVGCGISSFWLGRI